MLGLPASVTRPALLFLFVKTVSAAAVCGLTPQRHIIPGFVETEGSGVQGPPQIPSRFEGSLGYMRLCLQKKKSPVL